MTVATPEFYEARIRELTSINEDLMERNLQCKENVDFWQGQGNSLRSNRDSIVEGMRQWTLEALGNTEISQANAEEISNICGFELSNEVELAVSVEYYFTIQVPFGENAREIIDMIDFESINYPDEVTYMSAEVGSIG